MKFVCVYLAFSDFCRFFLTSKNKKESKRTPIGQNTFFRFRFAFFNPQAQANKSDSKRKLVVILIHIVICVYERKRDIFFLLPTLFNHAAKIPLACSMRKLRSLHMLLQNAQKKIGPHTQKKIKFFM